MSISLDRENSLSSHAFPYFHADVEADEHEIDEETSTPIVTVTSPKSTTVTSISTSPPVSIPTSISTSPPTSTPISIASTTSSIPPSSSSSHLRRNSASTLTSPTSTSPSTSTPVSPRTVTSTSPPIQPTLIYNTNERKTPPQAWFNTATSSHTTTSHSRSLQHPRDYVIEHIHLPAHVSRPRDVQRLIHVAWDEKLQAYTGVPAAWRDAIPQSVTVDDTDHVDGNSPRPTSKQSNISNLCLPRPVIPIPQRDDKVKLQRMIARVQGTRNRSPTAASRITSQSRSTSRHSTTRDRHPTISTPLISVKEYMKCLGFHDMDKLFNPTALRDALLIRLSMGPGGGLLVRMPYVIKLKLLGLLDASSLVSVCLSCSEMLQLMDNRVLWRPLVHHHNSTQRTLVSEISSDWKRTYCAMVELEKRPHVYDILWNVVVIGDRRVGKSKLVHTLASSAKQTQPMIPPTLARKGSELVIKDDPVIDAVSGIFRLGIDCVTRRVVIDSTIIKLQVWDGSGVGSGSLLNSAHVIAMVYDTTNRKSFEQIPTILTDTRKMLSSEADSLAIFMLFGNTCFEANQERQVTYDTAKRFANGMGMVYLEANANDSISVDTAFANLAAECMHTYSYDDGMNGIEKPEKEKDREREKEKERKRDRDRRDKERCNIQ